MTAAPSKVVALCAAAAAVAAGLAGCFGEGSSPNVPAHVARGPLTVYSSLPARGVSAHGAREVGVGQELALDDARRRAGGRRVRLVRLDSTRPGSHGAWDPGAVNENAERAADDPRAVAYLGELDYGGSAVSVPITNDAGILQVSPGDGLTSLTSRPPENPRAGPERYYPTKRRTFVRLVPTDLALASDLVRRMLAEGLRSASVVTDRTIYGRELAGVIAERAQRGGLDVRAVADFPRDLTGVPDAATDVAEQHPGAVILTGVADRTTGPLLAAIHRRMPRAPVFGPAGLGARPLRGALPRVSLLSPVRAMAGYPPRGRRVLRRLKRRLGAPAGAAALYGYESMRLALDAIDAGGPDRRRIVRAALTERSRSTVLGPLRVRASGDVSEKRFAVYVLSAGAFRYRDTIR